MKSKEAFSEKGRIVLLLGILVFLLLLPPSTAVSKILIGSNTRTGNEVVSLESCTAGNACSENATTGIELGRAVYDVQVADLDSDGLNDTSVYAAGSTTINLFELTTYSCNATGCYPVAEKSFDLPYGGAAIGSGVAFGNVDNSADGSKELVVGQSTASTAAARQEIRVFRCGTSERGWYGQNISRNGTAYNFRGASIFNNNLAFVVGDGGVGYRWDGGAWNWERLSTTNNTLDVTCADSKESFCMAGGANGFMAYWNGTPNVWTKVLRPGATQVNRITLLNSTFGFAAVNTVAAVTNIWRWNGTEWTAVTSPNAAYYSIDIFNDTFGFAGGTVGSIARWNGTSWNSVSSGSSATINSVQIWNATHAFAGTSTGQILKWNGTSWAVDTTPAATAISRVRYFNGSYAVAVLAANGYDAYYWRGSGSTGTWTANVTNVPRYGTYTDLSVYRDPNSNATTALGVGTTGIAIKYGNDTKKCFETDMSTDYYGIVSTVIVGDINNDGANELAVGGGTYSNTANNNEIQVWNCTTGKCVPTYSANHDSRQPTGAFYLGDVDGDGSNEIVRGMTVATTTATGTCGANELCVMRCTGMTCTNCGAGCMINTGLVTNSAEYGMGLEANQPTQGRIAIGVDRSTGAGNDIMIYKMGVANGGSANTLTLSSGGINVGTAGGAGQTIAYEMDAVPYFSGSTEQLLAPWAYLTNWTFGIHRCPDGTNACNFSSWFNVTVASYVVKYRDYMALNPFFTSNPSDGGSDQSAPTTKALNVTFSGTATTRTGNNWNLLVCSYPDARSGVCNPQHVQYCKSSATSSGNSASCQLNTSSFSVGNRTWFAFACDATTLECSDFYEATGTNTRPFFVNERPLASGATIGPPTPSSLDNLQCNGTITDETYSGTKARVSWFKNGANQTSLFREISVTNGTQSLLFTVLSGNLTVGDSWYCSIVPYDGFAEGTPANSSSVSVVDGSAPSASAVSSNVSTLEYGDAIKLSAYWTDTIALSSSKLETNETGTYSNVSTQSLSGAASWSNYTWSNSLVTPDNTTSWRIWANDTSNNWAATSYLTFDIRDTRAPRFSGAGENSTEVYSDGAIMFYSYWTDNYLLSHAKLETNETGTYSNVSVQSLSGTTSWSNFTWSSQSVPNNTLVSWRIWANDSKGNWNRTGYYNFTFFLTSDNTPPKHFFLSDNSTSGQLNYPEALKISAYWTDNRGLSVAKLETNETGTWQNTTSYNSPFSFPGEPEWSNFTWLNSSVLPWTRVGYRIWANDTSNNWNVTPLASFLVADNIIPSHSGSGSNTTSPDVGDAVLLYALWTDNYQLMGSKLETNETGTYSNVSFQALSGTSQWSNYTWANPSVGPGTTVAFRIWANDTSGNWAATPYMYFTPVDSGVPSVRAAGANWTYSYKGDRVRLFSQGQDYALSHAILSTNESGAWANYTGQYGSPASLGTSNTWTWSNFTWENSSFSGDLYWQIWYNDTSGNWNRTPNQILSILDSSISSSKPSLSSCGYVYYRTILRNSTDEPISADLTMRLLSPTLQIQTTQNIPDTSIVSGEYCGSVLLPQGTQLGNWWLKATSSGVMGNRSFIASVGNPNIWRIDLFLNSSTYYSSENLTANFTIYSLYGEGVPSLASNENMSVFINSTRILLGNVTDRGAGKYNLTFNLSIFSSGSNYLEILANSSGGQTVSKREGFLVV